MSYQAQQRNAHGETAVALAQRQRCAGGLGFGVESRCQDPIKLSSGYDRVLVFDLGFNATRIQLSGACFPK